MLASCAALLIRKNDENRTGSGENTDLRYFPSDAHTHRKFTCIRFAFDGKRSVAASAGTSPGAANTGEKLSFLIQTLVKASRLETGIVVPTPTLGPVAPLLEATVEQERPAAEKKKITLQNLPFVGDASFDPRWTSEALGNVVNNAVKYTPAGGRVTVSAQMLETFCRVDVTDTGPGIPEEEQGGIFNRFYRGTLTHSAEGLGLGLYLAREILSLQGGYIKVSSKPGNGSTFSLYLPRALNRI